ncbi:hypothetical protein SUGI_0106890 [Cryptomeria japonica]|nr:hypothetical protein SUGI_0106890 [Cryptomeria japonica]
MRASSAVKSNASGLLSFQTQKKKVSLRKKYVAIKARYGDYDCSEGPSLVDANMSVLRRRVYELNLQEKCHSLPQEWIALATLSLMLMGVGTSISFSLVMVWSNVDMFLHNL